MGALSGVVTSASPFAWDPCVVTLFSFRKSRVTTDCILREF